MNKERVLSHFLNIVRMNDKSLPHTHTGKKNNNDCILIILEGNFFFFFFFTPFFLKKIQCLFSLKRKK